MIVSYRCDKPMARSKGLLPCKKTCKSCVCCILRDDQGSERHALGGQRERSDPRLRARNLRLRGFFGDFID